MITKSYFIAIGEHKSVTKTLKRIKSEYSWPPMKQDIQNLIKNCKNCQPKKLM